MYSNLEKLKIMKALTKWKVLVMLIGTAFLCSSCVTMFPRRHHPPRPVYHEVPPPPPPHHHRPDHKPHHKYRRGPHRPMAFLSAQEMHLPETLFMANGKEA